MLHSPLLALAIAAVAAACDATPGDPPDAAEPPSDATAGPDAVPDAAPGADADSELRCDPSRTWNPIADRPMVEGDFCDDIVLCAPDARAAAAITAAAPGFVCNDEQMRGGCDPGEIPCRWPRPHELDADEWEQVCAVTVLDDAPRMTCWIYL